MWKSVALGERVDLGGILVSCGCVEGTLLDKIVRFVAK